MIQMLMIGTRFAGRFELPVLIINKQLKVEHYHIIKLSLITYNSIPTLRKALWK